MCMTHNYKLNEPVATLQEGGLLLFPTDTIWAVGCTIHDVPAVIRLQRLIQHNPDEPMTILVNSLDMLRQYVKHLHPRLETLLVYHVRPLTIVYDKGKNLHSTITGKTGNIAVRLTTDDYCKALISELGHPIVAMGASVENEQFPPNFGAISSTILEGVDHVVKYRQEEKSMQEPSVMVKLSKKSELIFLRE